MAEVAFWTFALRTAVEESVNSEWWSWDRLGEIVRCP